MSKKTERVLGPGADGDVDNTGPVTADPVAEAAEAEAKSKKEKE